MDDITNKRWTDILMTIECLICDLEPDEKEKLLDDIKVLLEDD